MRTSQLTTIAVASLIVATTAHLRCAVVSSLVTLASLAASPATPVSTNRKVYDMAYISTTHRSPRWPTFCSIEIPFANADEAPCASPSLHTERTFRRHRPSSDANANKVRSDVVRGCLSTTGQVALKERSLARWVVNKQKQEKKPEPLVVSEPALMVSALSTT